MPGVTKEQIQAAREADLFTYLQFHEPGVLKRDGPNFRHKAGKQITGGFENEKN